MRLYAHRGNVNGRNPKRENTLGYLQEALTAGFGVEVDVRTSNFDSQLYLGHDDPQELVSLEFLRDDRVITHAKDVRAFTKLLQYHEINVFFQNDDNVSLSSKGDIIHHVEHMFDADCKRSLFVLPGKSDIPLYTPLAGVISDEILHYRYGKNPVAKCFKLLALDVDGVLTNGRKIYGDSGTVVYKEFNDRDFTAIKRFRAAGIPVCLISGDINVNANMAKQRKLMLYDSRSGSETLDKSRLLEALMSDYKVLKNEIAFVGDDYYDLSMIESLNWTFCPIDAASIIKGRVMQVIPRNGGDGVIEWLFEDLHSKGLVTGAFPYE